MFRSVGARRRALWVVALIPAFIPAVALGSFGPLQYAYSVTVTRLFSGQSSTYVQFSALPGCNNSGGYLTVSWAAMNGGSVNEDRTKQIVATLLFAKATGTPMEVRYRQKARRLVGIAAQSMRSSSSDLLAWGAGVAVAERRAPERIPAIVLRQNRIFDQKHTRTVMKLGLGIAALALIGSSMSAWSAESTGTIIVMHLNGDVGYPDRGACIRMDPALDGPQWACLYKDNLLYKEITALLMGAKLSGATCRVQWNVADSSGYKVIRFIEC